MILYVKPKVLVVVVVVDGEESIKDILPERKNGIQHFSDSRYLGKQVHQEKRFHGTSSLGHDLGRRRPCSAGFYIISILDFRSELPRHNYFNSCTYVLSFKALGAEHIRATQVLQCRVHPLRK